MAPGEHNFFTCIWIQLMGRLNQMGTRYIEKVKENKRTRKEKKNAKITLGQKGFIEHQKANEMSEGLNSQYRDDLNTLM